jgi:hypothetical protein
MLPTTSSNVVVLSNTFVFCLELTCTRGRGFRNRFANASVVHLPCAITSTSKTNIDILDKRGEECRTLADAEKFAKHVARELAESKSPEELEGEFIVVLDESGKEVFRTPLTGNE